MTEDVLLHLTVPLAEDGGAALRDALDSARDWCAAGEDRRAVVTLAPGIHRVDAPTGSSPALTIRDTTGLELAGAGAELRFTDPRRGGIAIERCGGVLIDGIVIDYDRPSFAQGVITQVDPARGVFSFLPSPGYPGFDDRDLFVGAGYGTLRDARTGALKSDARQTFMITYAGTPGDDGAFAVTVAESDRAWIGDIEPGDGFVVGHRGEQHGIRIADSSRTVLRRVTIHAAPCAAIVSDDSAATVLDRVVVARRAGSPNWISTNADAFHCQGGRQGPTITGCRFEGMHDDGVNLYVRDFRVVGVGGSELELTGDGLLEPGDVLQLVDGSTGSITGEVRAHAVDARATGRLVVRTGPLPGGVRVGSSVYNRSNANSGFRIEDSVFHDFRGIGVRLKASSGVIARCTFTDLSGFGIWIANDPGWGEGPVGSRGVEISRNRFSGTPADRALLTWPHSAATIMIEAFDDADGPGASRAHAGIRLRANHVERTKAPAVFVGAADDVRISDLDLTGETGGQAIAVRDADVTVA